MVTARRLTAGLTFNVLMLSVVSFMTDVSSEMITPLLPFFITIELGATAFILGIIDGAAESTASLLKVFSGYWSDRLGKRKGLVFSGYSLSAIAKTFFPFVRGWGDLLGLKIGERVGKGVRTAPRDAILAESSPQMIRGKVFGFHRAADTLGAIVGPLLALTLMGLLLSYREIFLFAAIPALVATMLVLLVREEKRARASISSVRISLRALHSDLKYFIAVATTFALGSFSVSFLIIRVTGVGLTQSLAVTFYLLFNIVYAAFALPTGVLSDRIGRPRVIIMGYATFAIVCLGFIFFSDVLSVALLFALFGFSYALVEGVERAFVADLSPPELKATALGTYHTTIGLAKLPSSMIAGLLWVSLGPTYTFVYGLGLSALAFLLLGIFIVKVPKRVPQPSDETPTARV